MLWTPLAGSCHYPCLPTPACQSLPKALNCGGVKSWPALIFDPLFPDFPFKHKQKLPFVPDLRLTPSASEPSLVAASERVTVFLHYLTAIGFANTYLHSCHPKQNLRHWNLSCLDLVWCNKSCLSTCLDQRLTLAQATTVAATSVLSWQSDVGWHDMKTNAALSPATTFPEPCPLWPALNVWEF